MWSLT